MKPVQDIGRMVDTISKTDHVLVLLNRLAVTGGTIHQDVRTPSPQYTEFLQSSQQQQQQQQKLFTSAEAWRSELMSKRDAPAQRQSFLKGYGAAQQQQTDFPSRSHATDPLQVVLGEQSESPESRRLLRWTIVPRVAQPQGNVGLLEPVKSL